MKQFIYTKDYTIISVDSIRYIFIDEVADDNYIITARMNEDGYFTKEIQDFSSEEEAKAVMNKIMAALAQGVSYSVRRVSEYD